MKIIKLFFIAVSVLTIALSGEAFAKQTKDKPETQQKISESSLINSNKQSKTEENVRAKDRAEERHGLNESREPVNSRYNENSDRENSRGHRKER